MASYFGKRQSPKLINIPPNDSFLKFCENAMPVVIIPVSMETTTKKKWRPNTRI